MICAWCELRNDVRHFRTDRVVSADVLDESFSIPDTVIAKMAGRAAGRSAGCHTGYAAATTAPIWSTSLALPRRRVRLAWVPHRQAAKRCTIPAPGVVAIPFAGATRHGLAGFAFGLCQRRLEGSDAMATVGGCQCGDVRYEISGDPLALYICHCRECQKQSASAFGMSLQVKRAGFRITRGEARSWSRSTDSRGRLKCFFCPRCGSRIWHESDPPLDTVTIKAGSLDQSVDTSDAIHIWTSRALRNLCKSHLPVIVI